MPAEWTDAEIESLSAYIDGQLDESDRTALEARLILDADLRQELAAMRQTAAMLRDLPTIRAPRAFTLTPEMVGQIAVPAAAAAQLRVLPAAKQARPARRVWWVPAASAAGVVLLAGAFLVVTQQNSSGSVAPANVAQMATLPAGTAIASTPTAILEGSFMNTLAQNSMTQAIVGETLAETAQSDAAESAGEQAENDTETALDEAAPREAILPLPTQVTMTQVGMAAPVAPPQAQTGQSVPGVAPSPTAMPTATGEVMDIMLETLPTQRETVMTTTTATSSPDPKLNEPPAPVGANALPQSSGGGSTSPGAMAGMDGLNSDPNAPGFTVATVSPIQGTAIAQYNAPEPDANLADGADDQEIAVTAVEAASSTMLDSPADARIEPNDPIWIRWANALSEWVLRLLGR